MDLEWLLMEETPQYYQGNLVMEPSFSSNLDDLWGGHLPAVHTVESFDSDLLGLWMEGESPLQHSSSMVSIGYLTENDDEQDRQQQKRKRQDEIDDEEQNHHHQQQKRNEEEEKEQQPQQKKQRVVEDEDEDEAEDQEEIESDDKKSSGAKHVMSERNRRNRLNQQLFTLRSLVPNITKMDKRAILVDALAYLQSILQQTEAETEKLNAASDSSSEDSSTVVEDTVPPPPPPPPPQVDARCALSPAISEMDSEMLDDERFVLKITCNGAVGSLGQVQRVIESLGMEITFTSINEIDRDHLLTTTFLRAKKKGIITPEKLKHRVEIIASTLRL